MRNRPEKRLTSLYPAVKRVLRFPEKKGFGRFELRRNVIGIIGIIIIPIHMGAG